MSVGLLLAGCDAEEALPTPPTAPLVGYPIEAPVVLELIGRGAVPAEIRQSAEDPKAPLPLRVVEIRRGGAWREHRALLEDVDTGDVRAYAAGDLLPHGGVLVAIEPAAVRVMAGDAVVMELGLNEARAEAELVDDLRVKRRRRIRGGGGLSKAREAEVDAAVAALRAADAEQLAGAVQTLSRCGPLCAPKLVPLVGSSRPVPDGAVSLPGQVPKVTTVGSLAVALLEAATGVSFGDYADEPAEVTRAWRSWGGLD